ncbi:hypothetical protein BKA62DRAFT_627483 [Auriculariales sp. MPI-PUGE-AT-0066]|nr:hypothetical protein BKA62DRAFT_627483 [Auriculariales sp. MPI-PUGE-AT-0066]
MLVSHAKSSRAWRPCEPTSNWPPPRAQANVQCSQKHGVRLDAPFIDERAKLAQSIWHHAGRNPPTRRILKRRIRCLRNLHHVRTVQDAAACASNPCADAAPGNPQHRASKNCRCPHCSAHRQLGCNDPNACQNTARTLVNSLNEKWTPGWNLPDLSLEISQDQHAMNLFAEQYSNPVTFDPSFPRPGHPLEYARVFTDELKVKPNAPPPEHAVAGFHDELPPPNPEEIAACCGAVRNARQSNALAALAVSFPADNLRFTRQVDPNAPQTKDRAAALAIIEALKRTLPNTPLLIMSTPSEQSRG